MVVVGWDRGIDLRAADATPRSPSNEARPSSPRTPTRPTRAPTGLRGPGAGAILAAIEAASGVAAEVIGKPNPPILQAALARGRWRPPLVVGDRLDTDIEGPARLGWDSALVLTGISTREDLRASGVRATYVLEDLSGLLAD